MYSYIGATITMTPHFSELTLQACILWQPFIYFLSLQICLFWTFHINRLCPLCDSFYQFSKMFLRFVCLVSFSFFVVVVVCFISYCFCMVSVWSFNLYSAVPSPSFNHMGINLVCCFCDLTLCCLYFPIHLIICIFILMVKGHQVSIHLTWLLVCSIWARFIFHYWKWYCFKLFHACGFLIIP